MTIATILVGAMIIALTLWAMIHGARRKKSGPANNWQNEDYLAREADATWSEGSLHPRSEPPDSTGLGL